MTEAQAVLLRVAKDALRWFTNNIAGNALNGMYDDIACARLLRGGIEAVEQEERDTAHRASSDEVFVRR